jgi:thymidylate synthase (FAD)
MSENDTPNEPLVRPSSPALDEILGKQFDVLDDGFVRAVDYLGNDAAIVQAARVSYGEGTKAVSEDRALIRYLMRHRHTTPFEMCEIKLHVRVPMDTWRQWIRHRTASVNEYSTRYSIAIDRAQKTEPDRWRLQAPSNRQGSAEFLADAELGQHLSEREATLHELSRSIYEERLNHGVAREQARKDLPLSTYTEAYWKIDLHNLLHFLALRMDLHAQLEIREYANVIGELVERWVPMTWEAFRDYRLRSLELSAAEVELLRIVNGGDDATLRRELSQRGWDRRSDTGKLKANRERTEFTQKFEALYGYVPDWLQ